MNVTMYKWHKRANSTKVPGVGVPSTDFSCTLKQPTSIHDPVIILSTNDMSFTYAKIGAFDSRYYFVRDVVSTANGLVEYHLTEDTLASHKVEIGSSIQYVAYASQGYYANIIDPRIQTKSTRGVTYAVANSTIFAENDNYILTVFGAAPNAGIKGNGMSVSYLLSGQQLESLRHDLSDTSAWESIADYFRGNPLESIFSVKWIPYTIPNADLDSQEPLWIGNKRFGNHGYPRVKGWPIIIKTASVTIPVGTGDFRDYNPYTVCALYLPGIGFTDINPADYPNRVIDIIVNIEVVTGNVMYELYNNVSTLITTMNCSVAADCPLGRDVVNGQGILTGLGETVVGAGTSLAGLYSGSATTIMAASAAMLHGAASMNLAANKHTQTITGGFGSRTISANYDFWLYCASVDTQNPNDTNYIALQGRPVAEYKQINTLSGYVQCENAHVSIDGSSQEASEIENYLNSGIYYE